MTILGRRCAHKLDSISLEGRRRIEQRVMLVYLLQLNQYALENKLIAKEIYKRMEIK